MQTYIQTYIQTDIHTDRHTYRQTYIQTDIHTYRQTYIQTDIRVHTDRHTYRQTYIQTHIHTDRHTFRLGLHFDKRLNWKQHIIKTRKHLNLKTTELYWILGRHSPLSLLNKTLIYKVILKPVWTYGIELWGCASTSNIEIIQRYQSKMLRLITQAPWYVRNQTLHRDL